MTVNKDLEEGVHSGCVSIFTIKQGNAGCEWLLGERMNHTEHYSNVLNKLRREIF